MAKQYKAMAAGILHRQYEGGRVRPTVELSFGLGVVEFVPGDDGEAALDEFLETVRFEVGPDDLRVLAQRFGELADEAELRPRLSLSAYMPNGEDGR
jgi:hypothetical protein